MSPIFQSHDNVIKVSQITQLGEIPKYIEIPEPPAPDADSVQIKVLAAGIHRLLRIRMMG